MLEVHWWHWLAFAVLIAALLALDLFVFHRRSHAPSLRTSAGWSAFWVGLALVFNSLVWWWGYASGGGSKAGVEFLVALVVEKSLSMDNLFVFALVFRYFAVPLEHQYRVLHWGIIGAILLRLVFILAGIELIQRFDWTLAVFGAFLIYSGVKLGLSRGAEVHPDKNLVLRLARRHLRVTHEDHGPRFFAREAGRWCVTPLLLVLLVVESSDVLFAVDSVPAVLGVTHDPFIAFTSNVFAILGLRALYFLLAGVMDRFRYFHFGLSAVLVLIGVKMVAEYLVPRFLGGEQSWVVPSWLSLLLVAALLAASIAASLWVKDGRKDD